MPSEWSWWVLLWLVDCCYLLRKTCFSCCHPVCPLCYIPCNSYQFLCKTRTLSILLESHIQYLCFCFWDKPPQPPHPQLPPPVETELILQDNWKSGVWEISEFQWLAAMVNKISQLSNAVASVVFQTHVSNFTTFALSVKGSPSSSNKRVNMQCNESRNLLVNGKARLAL